ncbi:MAG: type II secretion system protein [Desulfuromonadaceae bacterium]|nr:type II secretion system protein [Desulfuromonadaceae bacterium]
MKLFGISHKGNSGFSLIELIITIAIMGIVMSIATINFQSWQTKNWMEAQLRGILVDLNEARTNSFTQKINHSITFQPDSYVLKNYSSDNEPRSAGRTITSKKLRYGITKKSNSNLAASIANEFVEFDSRGLASNSFTIIMNPLETDVAVNCLVVFDTRMNLGKVNGTECAFK